MTKVKKSQCAAMTRASLYSERCKIGCAPGSIYCTRCGTRRHGRSLKKAIGGGPRLGSLPMAYRYMMSASLRKKMAEMQGQQSPLEQLGLFDELALMRQLAQGAVATWDAATCDENEDKKVPEQLKAAAGILMREALNDVAKMAEHVAKIEGMAADKLSIAQLGIVVDQIVHLAHEVFGQDDETLERCKIFSALVNERIKIPTLEVKGTSITPDQDVMAMDATVPCITVDATVSPTVSNGDHNGNGHSNGNGHVP